MTDISAASRTLPVPSSLTLRNFSLYENLREVSVDFGPGVFCLAGANGLGKSTFLNILSFAITGVVPEPGRKFDSLPEYLKFTAPYASSYFAGRIQNQDRQLATVEVEMAVGAHTYRLVRSFFDGDTLAYLEIAGPDGPIVEFDEGQSDSQRGASYRENIVRDCGLARFEQLVFLQHFLLTFDEQHRLLLWDDRTIEQALLLAFGVSATAAAEVDDLRRRAERFDSQARNLQYQATTADGRIRDLLGRVDDSGNEDNDDREWEEAERQWQALNEQLSRLNDELSSAQTVEAETHAKFTSAEQQYEEYFKSITNVRVDQHPIILATVQNDMCEICGTAGARARLRDNVAPHQCPLCSAELGQADESVGELTDLASALADLRRSAALASDRVSALVAARITTLAELGQFEAERYATADSGSPALNKASVRALVAQYRAEAADARKRRDEYRSQRDTLRGQLKPVARDLAKRYSVGEEVFVPRFTSLAHSFLGLDVDVYLQQRASRPSLVVTIEGTERRSFDQLSESQRFFLDIALRMALVEYMSGGGGGCLFIDTPEGSLDISYEARAGEMFADFAGANKLIMTANINSSQLLLSLAQQCGPSLMRIVRMMDWTKLSDVQAEGEELFHKAFSELQEALSEKPV